MRRPGHVDPATAAETRRGRALVLLLVLAGFVALIAWYSSDPSGADAIEPAPAEAVGARAEQSTAFVSAESVSRSARRATAVAAQHDAAERAPLDAVIEIDATPREPVDVLVVDKATGEAVAGAEVRWANLAELDFQGSERPRWRPDPIAHFAGARRATTDAEGRARIDARVFPGAVLARHGDRLGRVGTHAPGALPIRVEIAPDVGLAIQVVDESGRPVAGVPVCLRAVPHLDSMGELWFGTTEGADGIARVRERGLLQPKTPPWTSAFACLDIVLREAVCVPVDLTEARKEPVRLVLPPCGSVVVALRDAEHRPASVLALQLGLAEKADKKGELRWSARGHEPDELREGRALYRFVGLGLDLHAVAMTGLGNAVARGLGPRSVGEVAQLELDVGAPRVVFTGRLVTNEGQPIRDRHVQVGFDARDARGPAGSRSHPLRTDSHGRFRLPVLTTVAGAASVALVFAPIGLGLGEGGEAQAEVRLQDPRAEHDLGDLRVREVPRIAAGVIVDEAAAPVPGAMLAVHVQRPDHSPGTWIQHALVRAATRPDGTFEIRTTIEVARLRVRASRPDLPASLPVEFEPGRRDLRLVIAEACEVRGRALLDAGIDAARVRVRLLVPGAAIPTEPLGPDRETRLAADGSFRIAPIPPGRFDLDFRVGANSAPFHRLEGLDVASRGGSLDARLDAIDLRGRVSPPRSR